MNLVLEYMIRTGVIKDFLKPPCSLFVNSVRGNSRTVISFLENGSNEYKIRHWFVTQKRDNLLPEHKTYIIEKEELFHSDKVIMPEHFPLQYYEQPIDTSTNAYNHPMPKSVYEDYCKKFMNSASHRLSKEVWLWNTFISCRYDRELRDPNIFEISSVRREQRWARLNNKDMWSSWMLWAKVMLVSSGAAPELIFSSSFSSF